MARSSFRHLFTPEILVSISPGVLIQLLSRHRDYAAKRGLVLPDSPDGWEPDIDQLSALVNNADTETPPDLYEALYFIHELADPEGYSVLLEGFGLDALKLTDSASVTPADVAVRAWLADADLCKRKHAELRIAHRRAWDYFFTDESPVPPLGSDLTPKLKKLESALAIKFKMSLSGDHCRVFQFQRDDGICLMIRHGDPFKRDLQEKDGNQAIIVYRPMRYDVAVVDPVKGAVKINASPRRRVALYRALLGECLYDNKLFYSRTDRYTLEPLRTQGAKALRCPDVAEIERIRLVSIEYLWDGPDGETETRSASDIFAAYARRDAAIPKRVPLGSATFVLEFRGNKKPRSITLDVPNKGSFTRDGDAALVESWLEKRGFMRPAVAPPPPLMLGFWNALTKVEGLAATESEWRKHMGAEFDWVRHLMSPADGHASELVDDDGVKRRVVKHAAGDFTAVSDDDGSSILCDADDVIIYEIDRDAIGVTLCRAFKFDEQVDQVAGIPRLLHVGQFQPCAGIHFRVYLALAADASGLQRIAEALSARFDNAFILLVPTANTIDMHVQQTLARKKSACIALDEAVEFMDNGSVIKTDVGAAKLNEFERALVPAQGEKNKVGMAFFRTPVNARWGHVYINLCDGETVSIKVKRETGVFNYADMGMIDRRAHKPNVQWELLCAFARNRGEIGWDSRDSSPKLRKRKELLNAALSRFFRIEGEAITFEEGVGYKASFQVCEGDADLAEDNSPD